MKDTTMSYDTWPRTRRRTNTPRFELEPWPWQESYERPMPFMPFSPKQDWRRASRRRFALDCLGLGVVLTVALLLYAIFAPVNTGTAASVDIGTTPLTAARAMPLAN